MGVNAILYRWHIATNGSTSEPPRQTLLSANPRIVANRQAATVPDNKSRYGNDTAGRPPEGWELVEGLQRIPVDRSQVLGLAVIQREIQQNRLNGIHTVNNNEITSNSSSNNNNGIIAPAAPDHLLPTASGDKVIPETDGMKVILFWNSFFNVEDFRFGFGHEPFGGCSCSTCMTTNDRSLLSKASAIVFHGPHIYGFPPYRLPGQIYVYVQQEPHYYLSEVSLPNYRGMFNLTMTHRPDSDIHIPLARVLHQSEQAKAKPKWVNPAKRPKSVVALMEHCHTTSKREMYLQELKKHIDVEVYGKCGQKRCDKALWKCMNDIEKEFKFYLSFEKLYCTDYATLHLYRPLGYDIIPIVYGGANYSTMAPPNSVIDIKDHPNPADMAKYLKSLGQNGKRYSEYLAWKSQGYSIDLDHKPIMTTAFCRLCQILHDPEYSYRSADYVDLKSWWVNGMCDQFYMGKFRRDNDW